VLMATTYAISEDRKLRRNINCLSFCKKNTGDNFAGLLTRNLFRNSFTVQENRLLISFRDEMINKCSVDAKGFGTHLLAPFFSSHAYLDRRLRDLADG